MDIDDHRQSGRQQAIEGCIQLGQMGIIDQIRVLFIQQVTQIDGQPHEGEPGFHQIIEIRIIKTGLDVILFFGLRQPEPESQVDAFG